MYVYDTRTIIKKSVGTYCIPSYQGVYILKQFQRRRRWCGVLCSITLHWYMYTRNECVPHVMSRPEFEMC